MMGTMPNIHSCLQLSSENERIRAKYKKLHKRNTVLAEELKKLKENFKVDRFFESQGRTKSVQVQTERKFPISRPVTSGTSKTVRSTQVNYPEEQTTMKSDKFLSMHSNLMKRYQKELRTNTLQIEQIAALTLENIELKQQLEEYKNKTASQEKQNESLQMRINNISVRERLTPSKRDLLSDLDKATKERNKLLQERKKFKEELKMLDRGFFEEIEDLKFALQQSAKLNTAYEAALKRLCKQFGVPIPTLTGSCKNKHTRRQQQRQFR